MSKVLRVLCAIVVVWLAGTRSTQAAMVTYDFNIEFSGATAPAGPAPWIRAVFDDTINPGYVTLTMTALNLTGGEFIDAWYFNLNPNLDPEDLLFTAVNTKAVKNDVTISQGTNAFKADGDGLYDFVFDFPQSNANGRRFTDNETVVYKIGGISGLTALDFAYLSQPAGGHGPFYSAAHVQGIGPSGNDSGWIAPFIQNGGGGGETPVPEPGSLLLLGSGLVLVGRQLRRRRRLQAAAALEAGIGS